MNNELARQVGRHIKEYRLRRQLDQTQCAAKLHVSQRAWSDYERGKGLNLRNIVKIAEILDVPLPLLMFGSDGLSTEGNALASETSALLSTLPEDQQRLIRDMVAAQARNNDLNTEHAVKPSGSKPRERVR